MPDSPKPTAPGWRKNHLQPGSWISWIYDGPSPPPPMPTEALQDMNPHGEIARLRSALKEIERLSPQPGGVGQIARDALRIGA